VAADGDVFVTDSENHRFQRFGATGQFLGAWGINGGSDGDFRLPWGIAVSASGDLYIADRQNDRVQQFALADS
jgi:tripartite motif-containing protein 71